MGGDLEMSLPNGFVDVESDQDYGQLMLQAGYKFNDYVAIEGRYWFGLDDNDINDAINTELDAFGIYVKPMYPVTDTFDVYALLGYVDIDFSSSSDKLESDDTSGFSWGIGAAYSFTENVAIFVDYVSLYSDDDINKYGNNIDLTVDTFSFGVTYQF